MFRSFFVASLLVIAGAFPVSAQSGVEMGPDGLHLQDWFFESSGDIRLDLLAAAAAQKDMVVLFEQEGCVYCIKLHEDNFSRPEIVKFMTDNFIVVQLDMRGSDMITGFDGVRMSEAQLARQWSVGTTPTTVVLVSENPGVTSEKAAEVFRLPGYLKPFEYYAVLDFFASGAYETQGLGAFMKVTAAEFQERGIDPKAW